MKYKILLILIFASFIEAVAQDVLLPPNREFRGVWVSTVFSLDWPKSTAAEVQKEELIALFDAVRAANMNAVLLQVRAESDAFYNSTKEPWSRWLTGVQGQDPGYDPLAFAIEEAHKRGLELHAWINPFRVNASTSASTLYSDDHISNAQPELVLEYASGQKIINPGIPEAREYVVSVIEEITLNYAIDGIHFDDYFYPYTGTTDEDAATFATYGGEFDNVGDWRRHNVNETVRQVNEAIKAISPGVRFGISPFGIWKNNVPSGIVGMDAYSVIYADAVHWLENQTVDYITPQLYWPIGGAQDFKKLLEWWAEQAGSSSRHLYAGHTLNEINSSGERVSGGGMRSISLMENENTISNFKNAFENQKLAAQSIREVPNQISIVRENRDNNALGSVFFRAAFLTANPHGFTDYLRENTYQYPAAPPEMEWIDADPPVEPVALTADVSEASGDYVLSWDRSAENTHDFKRYVLYNLASEAGDFSDFGAVRELLVSEEITIPYDELPFGTSYWAVTELGPLNHESAKSNIVTIENHVVPLVENPVAQETVTENSYVRFDWTGQEGMETFHYQWAADEAFSTLLEENDTLDASSTARLFNNLEFGEDYYFRLRARNKSNWSDWTPSYKVTIGNSITGIGQSAIVDHLKIYPNPSHDQLHLDLHIKRATTLDVALMTMGGRKINLINGKYNTGSYRINIDKETVGSGVYMLVLQVDDHKEVQKIIFN